MCTTVSTSCPVITLAITGLRMSARTNATLPRSPRGGTTSTPMTRSTAGSAAMPAREPATEVTRDSGDQDDATHRGCPSPRASPGYLPWRRRWMRVFFSSLRCFFLAIRLRRFLTTEPTDGPSGTSRRPGADVLAGDAPDRCNCWTRAAPGFPRARREAPSLTVARGARNGPPDRVPPARRVKIRRVRGPPLKWPPAGESETPCASRCGPEPLWHPRAHVRPWEGPYS